MAKQYRNRLYSNKECYRLLDDLITSMKYIRKNKNKKLVSDAFKERIMLAVTEVNGCEVCSYAHTGFALKSGVSEDEINAVLSGDLSNAPKEESVALFFGQHYAETKGYPDKENWDRLVSTYGEEKSLVILGDIRIIMVGNAYGAVFGSFKGRFSGKKNKKSSLGYELSVLLSLVVFVPFILIKNLFGGRRERTLLSTQTKN